MAQSRGAVSVGSQECDVSKASWYYEEINVGASSSRWHQKTGLGAVGVVWSEVKKVMWVMEAGKVKIVKSGYCSRDDTMDKVSGSVEVAGKLSK